MTTCAIEYIGLQHSIEIDKSGIMYQNLFDYMFAYSNYTASEGKIVSTYTTSDKKTTDKYTYSVDGDTLTLNNDAYSRISFSDLK